MENSLNYSIPQMICGHCKTVCLGFDELKQHMKVAHLPKSSMTVSSIDVSSIEHHELETELKQPVLIYRQNVDGSTSSTGQILHLTQSQIAQLLNTSQNKPVVSDRSPTCLPQGVKRKGHLQVVGTEAVDQIVKSNTTLPESIVLQDDQLSRSMKYKAGEAILVSTTYPHEREASGDLFKLDSVVASIEGNAAGRTNQDVAEIKFQFPWSNSDALLYPTHIKPVVTFQCDHCSYKDVSFMKATIHVRNFHLKSDGTVSRKTASADTHQMMDSETKDDLSCPYCLTRFPTLQQRDEHRIKFCGPKKRYEVKRTAVRTLQRHLVCPETGCTRALYFSEHPQAIKHPRATFGSCHRNNGSSHYFTCFLCALKDEQEWKKPSAAEMTDQMNSRMQRKISELPDRDEKSMDQETSQPEASRAEKLVIVQSEMKSWDFPSWAECANHLISDHLSSLSSLPRCDKCGVTFTSCNSLCHHVFNHEKEYADNYTVSVHSRQDKKSYKSSFLFALPKDNSADEMLFFEMPNGVIANSEQSLSSEKQEAIKRVSMKGKRYLCRTCGEGFSTIARRDKHTLSNACSRMAVDKKFSCSICNRRFQSKRTHLTHESWCLYKEKRKQKIEENALEGNNPSNEPNIVPVENILSLHSLNENTASSVTSVINVTEMSHTVSDGLQTISSRKKEIKKPRPKKYKCTVLGCRLGFDTEEESSIHQQCHINNTVAFQCCFCDFKTSSNVSWFPLKEHIIAKHPGNIKPSFECPICSKGFAKVTKFDDHMTKHSEEKPFECIECGVKFKQESGLRAHVQAEHSTDEAREFARSGLYGSKKLNLPPLLCHVCGYTTTSRSYYKTHMNIHKGVKPYTCKQCDYKSVDSTCFKRHMWRHKEEKPYKCLYCTFDGIQRAQVVAHMKTKHNVWPNDAKKLIRHISGRRQVNWKSDDGEGDCLTNQADHQLIQVHVTADPVDLSQLHAATNLIQSDTSTLSQTLSNAASAAVSIMNPDGTETTIPVELITQSTDGLEAGTIVQVTYGDYMTNYSLDKSDEVMDSFGNAH